MSGHALVFTMNIFMCTDHMVVHFDLSSLLTSLTCCLVWSI